MNLFNQNPNARELKIDSALDFLFAGKATFTIKSKATGKHFTYKLAEPKKKNPNKQVHFVKLLTGTDNESSYTFFGTFFDRAVFKFGKSTRITPTAPGVVAFTWFMRQLLTGNKEKAAEVELYHEGCCCRCGRKLTTPESIENGIGPECIKMMSRK